MSYNKHNLAMVMLLLAASTIVLAQPSLTKEYIYLDSRVIAVDSPLVSFPPPTVSAGPNPTTGTSGTFEFRGTSANGGGYISVLLGMFTARAYTDGRDSCSFAAKGNGLIYLKKDDDTDWVVPNGSPVGSGTVSNSQCSIDLSASTVTVIGNNLVVRLAITFQPTFAGYQNLFLLAVDAAGNSTNGWQLISGYTFRAYSAPPTNFVRTLTSNNYDGIAGTFTYKVTNSAYMGANFVSSGIILINRNIDSGNACYIQFFRADRSFRMIHGGSTGIAGQLGQNSTNLTLDGVECKLDVTNSSIIVSTTTSTNDTLTVTAQIQFKQPADLAVPFRGLMGKVFNYALLTDRAAVIDPTWAQQMQVGNSALAQTYNIRPNTTDRTFYVTTGIDPQTFTGNTPAAQTSVTKRYSFQTQHNLSGRYVDWMQVYMASGKCYIFYSNTDDLFLLGNANSSGWVGVLPRLNSNGSTSTASLDNGTGCAITAAGSTVDRDTPLDKLGINITFYKTSFQGIQYINMYSMDRGGNDDVNPWNGATGWVTMWQ